MKIAIITGASAGLGLEFLKALPSHFPEIEEYWLIARRREKLEEAAALADRPCRILPLDLTAGDSYTALAAALEEAKPELSLLINNSGCGYWGNVGEGELDNQLRMIELNLRGLTAVTHIAIPHMTKGSRIINISSIASFCPNARMTVYSATKSYVTAFSYGITEELRKKGIKATAVCPGPMDTEFIYLGSIKGNSATFDRLPYCKPEKVAKGALRAAKKGRMNYTPHPFYKLYKILAKFLPVALVMKMSKT
ncbi:MAG: SDR family NAD(P)-dependent oxidoreductase [Ruminococcaceae bacterium]|nr:SDR family NAD(P)-dependent oxidoreductase [Oscillospiraceae bacterium]